MAFYFRIFDEYPLVVAANRDEFFSRPSAPPAILSNNPLIVAGQDLVAGGTWLGVNQHGLLAGILNRRANDMKIEARNMRSRGLLCLELLQSEGLDEAIVRLKDHNHRVYQPFNLLYANERAAFVSYNLDREIRTIALKPGLHVLSNTSVYDTRSDKMARAYRLFSEAVSHFTPPEGNADFMISIFQKILSDHVMSEPNTAKQAICVHAGEYGTVSSSIVAYSRREKRFHTYFCPAAPCRAPIAKSLSVDVP